MKSISISSSSFHLAAIFAALCLSSASSAHAGGSVPFDEDPLQALDQTPFAQTLSQLEFHPIVSAERIGNNYPKLSGARLGPYECLARLPSPDNKPGVYSLRVVISTKPTYVDADGKEVPLSDKADSKTEKAIKVEMIPLEGKEADTGDKESKPILLGDMLGINAERVIQNERFFLASQSLQSGMTSKQVETVLGSAKIARDKPLFVEATGDTMETWSIDSLDLNLDFTIDPDKGTKTLTNLNAGPNSKLETARGIRIGHPEARVKAAYADIYNRHDSHEGELVTIGNPYLGLFIQIEKGKVTGFHLGMGAE